MNYGNYSTVHFTGGAPRRPKLELMGSIISADEVVKRANGWYLNRTVGQGGYLTFAAEWCHYCKELAPQMNQASTIAGIKSYVIDGDSPSTSNLRTQMNVSGFPTVFIVDRAGRLSEYNGERTPQALIQALSKTMNGGNAPNQFPWWG